MRVSPINKLNFTSKLPIQSTKKDGWDELEKICSESQKTKGMLLEQPKLLNTNGNQDILSLTHTPLDNSPNNETFAFYCRFVFRIFDSTFSSRNL